MVRAGFVLMLVMLVLAQEWVIPTQAQDSTHNGDETQILALENAWNQAELHNDPAALRHPFSPPDRDFQGFA